jgi:hypothetical protein
MGDPKRGKGELAVGLLPAEPTIRGEPGGKDHSAGIDSLDPPGNADPSATAAPSGPLEGLAQAAEKALSRRREQWRSRPS